MTVRTAVRLETSESVRNYILGGKSLVIFVSNKTNKSHVFRINVCDRKPNLHFVWAKNNVQSRYIGTIKEGKHFVWTCKGVDPYQQYMYKIFKWVWDNIYNGVMPDNLVVYHYGTCCRCGRTLTDPKSIKRGIGPECIKYASA